MGTGGRHSHAGPSAAAVAAAATHPGLPLRRYSVPEAVMRRASLRQRAAAQSAVNEQPKKQDDKCNKGDPPEKEGHPQEEDPKKPQNIAVISERSVVKCETTSQCFSMTLSSSTVTECKVSVSDVPKVPEPCSKKSEKKAHFSKEEEGEEDPQRLDSTTKHSYCTTVENLNTAAKEMTEEDQEVQHIMSEKQGSTPACCRRHRRPSTSPYSSPYKDASTEMAGSPLGKNSPDSASSSVTLDQSVSERSSSTQDSTLSVRSETNSPRERRRRTPTPYNRLDKKGVIRDVCGNKVHVLSETSSFIVFETPSPSPYPSPSPSPCNPYPDESCCCVCSCCKRCERECNVRTNRKKISQTTQTTEDRTTSVNTRDRRSMNVKSQTEQSSATVDATVNRESPQNKEDCAADLFGVDSNGNVTFCPTGVETDQTNPKSQSMPTKDGEATDKPKDTYLVKTETIEKWDSDKREWTEKKVSHVVQHQPGPPVRDAKTYTLSNRINIANNNPTLVASEIVEIPPSERHAFCVNDKNAAGTCPMCQEEKQEVTLPSIKPTETQNIKNETEFWNRLMGQSTRAQTIIPKIGENQTTETPAVTGEDLYPWSKRPEKGDQIESVVDVTTTVEGEEATVVPRYSAVPRTVSMLVNTSSADASDSDSECLSCADSLESVHIPRKSNKHDSKPVRGHVLLPENAPKKDTTRRIQPPKVYFIRLLEDDGVVEGDSTPVSECMPERLKVKLVERHTSVRHTEHCRHHEEERYQHSRSVHDRHQDVHREETKVSPQHKSMASQAVIKECATKSTSTQRSRSKREIPAIVRVHKCHLEEDVRPIFKAKPYKGVTASTLKTKLAKQPAPLSEPLKLKPEAKTKPRKEPPPTHPPQTTDCPPLKTVRQKQDHSTHTEETTKVEEKSAKAQSSSQTQTTTSTSSKKEELAKAIQKLHNFNHAMQTQTTPPKSVETLTVNLEDGGKRVAKSSQTEAKTRPTRTPSEKNRRNVPSSPLVKPDLKSPATKPIPRQINPATSETPRKKDAAKADESTGTGHILGGTYEKGGEGSHLEHKLETSSQQRLTTPRRSGSIARFRHKFPVIPEEQREVSPSSPSRGHSQRRRSPAVITSLNAMSQTDPIEPEDEGKNGDANSSSNTESRSDIDQDSQPIHYTVKVRTSPDFNSQTQQTNTLPQPSQCKLPQTKTSGGTQTDHSDVIVTKQNTLARRSVWVDAATSTEARKTDASTSTSTPRSTVSSATIQKETKTSTTVQKETTKSSSTHSADTIVQKESTKCTSTQSSPPESAVKPQQKSNPIPAKSTQTTKPSSVTKLTAAPKPSTTPKPPAQSTTATPTVPKYVESAPSATTKPKDTAKPTHPKAAAAPVKPTNPLSAPTERTKGSWTSRGTSFESNQAYNRRKAAAIEHVNRLQRLLHHGPAMSLSACDDISSGGSCQSDSTNYLSPPEMSTSPGWGAGDGRVSTSASLASRRHVRSRPSRRDPAVSSDRHLYRHHEPPRLSAPGPPPSDGTGWTVTVAGGSNVGSVVGGGVSSLVDPNNGAAELEMRVMIAEATSMPTNHSGGSSRWSLTIRNQPNAAADRQAPPDSASCGSRRPPSLTWPRVQHFINGSASPRQRDSSSHQLSVTGSAIKRKFIRHLN